MRVGTALCALFLTAPPVFCFEFGLNTNAPIDGSTGAISAAQNPDLATALGADIVRLNAIRGPWTGPTDTTRRGPDNLTWFETYDRIVDGYLDAGVDVYMLVGSEAVSGWTRPDLATEAFVQSYTANFLAIVQHFEGRVQTFEMFNEPNDWAGGTSAQVPPYWCARQMESIYRAVKIDNGALENPIRQNMILVSPPLFTFSGTDGSDYFTQVWQAGRNQLDWNTVKTLTGSYPFDGVGYHIYVAEGLAQSNTDLVTLTNRNLNGIWSSVTALEGTGSNKKLYVSEFGFRPDFLSEANNPADPAGQQEQANRLETAFGVYTADPRVAQAHWFSLISFPGGEYGLFNQGALTEDNRRPAWFRFRDLATASTGDPADAALASTNIPLWFQPGVPQAITLSYRNTGTATWPPAGEYRLATGSTPSGNFFENQVPWTGTLNGGYSNGPLDARVYTGPGPVAAGGVALFPFEGTFPAGESPGVRTFAARMVQEGADFFGEPVDARLAVGLRGQSLLQNGSFEAGSLASWQVVAGSTDGVQTTDSFFGVGPSEGTSFLGAAANFGQKSGTIAQQVSAVPGEWYGALATIQTFREGGAPGDTAGRIGIDPSGGTNPSAPGVVWSVYTESPGAPARIGTFAEASGGTITVYLEARHAAPLWNVTAIDDALVFGKQTEVILEGISIR